MHLLGQRKLINLRVNEMRGTVIGGGSIKCTLKYKKSRVLE